MGKWEKSENRDGEYICSECGEYQPKFERHFDGIDWQGHEYYTVKLVPYLTPHCPFCGERMENGKA